MKNFRFFGPDDEEETPVIDPPVIDPPVVTEKKFTQDELNRFLAEERRKAAKSSEKTVKELEALKKNASLTEAEKASLEERIETIRNESLTKEELAKKEQAKERNKAKQEYETKEKEAKRWRELYESSTTETGLISAASSDPDVFNPQQIVDLLLPKTRLVEELDDSGKPTGKFTPKVRFSGKDQDGKEVTLDLTPTEAVKQMKEIPEKYGNLFRNGATGGVGGNNLANVNRDDSIPSDPVAFRAMRKKNPDYMNKVK